MTDQAVRRSSSLSVGNRRALVGALLLLFCSACSLNTNAPQGNSEIYGGTDAARLRLFVAQTQLGNAVAQLQAGQDTGTLCTCPSSVDPTVCGLIDDASSLQIQDAETLLNGALGDAATQLARTDLTELEDGQPDLTSTEAGGNPAITEGASSLTAWTWLGPLGTIGFSHSDVLQLSNSLSFLRETLAHEVIHKVQNSFGVGYQTGGKFYLDDSTPMPHFSTSWELVSLAAACLASYAEAHSTSTSQLSLQYLDYGGNIVEVSYSYGASAPVFSKRTDLTPQPGVQSAKTNGTSIVYYPYGSFCFPSGPCPDYTITDAAVGPDATYFLTVLGEIYKGDNQTLVTTNLNLQSLAYLSGVWYLLFSDGSVHMTSNLGDPSTYVTVTGLNLPNAATLAMGAGPTPH